MEKKLIRKQEIEDKKKYDSKICISYFYNIEF